MTQIETTTNPPRCAGEMELTIDGAPEPLTSDHTISFVERLDGSLIPVLYHCGRRVRGNWSLKFDYQRQAGGRPTSPSPTSATT